MDDLFSEVLISRKPTFLNYFVKFLLVLITILFFLSGIIMHPLFLFAGFGMILLDMWLFPRQSVEYEYSYVNGELDVDEIFGKKSRKHLASYHMHDAEVIAPAGSDHLSDVKNLPEIDYTSGTPEDMKNAWIFAISSNGRHVKVRFSPDDSILKDLRRRIPGKMFLQ